MRRVVRALSLLALAASVAAAQGPAEKQSDAPFRGPEVSEAGELANFRFIGGVGIAVLEPVIGEEGNVESVKVIRSTPGLESWAAGAVKAWKFRPAVIHGKPCRSKTTVVLVFNQGFNVPPAMSLPPLAEDQGKGDREKDRERDKLADFSPALPTEVVIPEYPVMSVLTTTVVLRVGIESSGDVQSVAPLREVAAYSPRAVDAVKKWQFSAAMLEGQPVRSTMTVAILFVPPPVTN